MATGNKTMDAATAHYESVCQNYIDTLKGKGVRFAEPHADDEAVADLRKQLADAGARFANAGASIIWGWQSQACVECTGVRGSETFSTTFKCHRDCYFCFNHNQKNYDDYFDEGIPWKEGLDRAEKTYDDLACLALTGGEPLLMFQDSISFLEEARKRFPDAHKRMYTSGDLLSESMAAELRDAGLQEIRFSVKVEDSPELQARVLANMEMAKRYIPDVMVEMPIIPGTEELMHGLFWEFDRIGIDGINLLEFCFPFCNQEEFDKRGFLMRNPPFPIMYDYMYSGGLAISGSEELALKLMLWGIREGVGFGMHYCSLENKHRSEMRQRNGLGAHSHPVFSFDEGDFFLKAAKVFGDDVEPARRILGEAGCCDILEDEEEPSLLFPLAFASECKDALANQGIKVAISVNVLETDDDGSYISEVGLEL